MNNNPIIIIETGKNGFGDILYSVVQDGIFLCKDVSQPIAETLKSALDVTNESGLTPMELLKIKNDLTDTAKWDGETIIKLAKVNDDLLKQREELITACQTLGDFGKDAYDQIEAMKNLFSQICGSFALERCEQFELHREAQDFSQQIPGTNPKNIHK